MVKRRPIFQQLPSNYLFPEIGRRKAAFLEKTPTASLISLGVGDTVKPLAPSITLAMQKAAAALGTDRGYLGYGSDQGHVLLREKICSRLYKGRIATDEIFISDGAKCDIGRLQMLFGGSIKVAHQDPAYPVYVEGSILQGVETLTPLSCTPENSFFPDFSHLPPHDLLYICHPNNPTGIAYTHEQLQTLVDYATEHHAMILFDTAYASFIQDPSLPRSIYEISGAEKVAIEIGSFSKMAGFSGIRLGWTVVPRALCYQGGDPVWNDWKRLTATIYNGASLIAEHGGVAALEEDGWNAIQKTLQIYLSNAKRLKEGFEGKGLTVYGGQNAPYLWVHYPERSSWDIFQEFLEEKHLIVTPGVGFGPSGESFIRVSAFAHEEEISNALRRDVASLAT